MVVVVKLVLMVTIVAVDGEVGEVKGESETELKSKNGAERIKGVSCGLRVFNF